MATREIVLGTDSGTFWTGRDDYPWLDDPSVAHVFASPREAWRTRLRSRNRRPSIWRTLPSSCISATRIYLGRPDRSTSTRHASNRPGLRAQWRRGFREALPPDLPSPLPEGDSLNLYRLEEYLRDIDWDEVRLRDGG